MGKTGGGADQSHRGMPTSSFRAGKRRQCVQRMSSKSTRVGIGRGWPVAPPIACVFVLTLWASVANAAQPSCKRFRSPPATVDVACARIGEADPGPASIGRLHATIDARIKDGDFAQAGAALACASALTSNAGWRDQYETVRRHGVLDYRRERVPEALEAFECALAIAERHRFRAGIAKQSKNIGAALLRIGDVRGAQAALERSLAIQRTDASEDIGSVLNNLGDLYREQNDHRTALRYYDEALENYRRTDNPIEVAHTLETIGVMALDRGDTERAIVLLTQAMRGLDREGHRPYRLRVYAGLTRAAAQDGDFAAARRWVAEGLAFAAQHRLSLPPELQLQAARVERAEGRAPEAIVRLSQALAGLPVGDPQRSALLEERALALSDVGAHAESIATLREAKEAERRAAQARFDQRIAWQRSRLEAVERERRIASLEAEGRQARLWTGVALLVALAIALGTGLYWQRRHQRAREAAAAHRARYEEALQRYRSEAAALRIDRRLLRALLATYEGAVCLLDGDGHVLAANQGACALLGTDEPSLLGLSFSERIAPACRERWAQAVYDIEVRRSEALRLTAVAGAVLDARITQWEEEAGVLILSLRDGTGSTPDATTTTTVETPSQDAAAQPRPHAPAEDAERGPPSADADDDARKRYRRNLVDLMLATIEHWERSTGTNRIELAERSRIWRIGVDDGRLRARAMERYLSLSQLPQYPRWRDVLRTVYYVLGHCALETEARDGLQRRVDEVLAYCRRGAYEE